MVSSGCFFLLLLFVLFGYAQSGDYFVLLHPAPENVSSKRYLSDHLDFVRSAIPHAQIYETFWSLAEKVDLFLYCISIDTKLHSLHFGNMSHQIRTVESVGMLHVAGIESTFPGAKAIDSTLSRFRKNRKSDSDVILDSFYTTEEDSRCVFDAESVVELRNSQIEYNTSYPVKIYVLDTGIHDSHIQFESTVTPGFNFQANPMSPRDPNGHGTQVAGVARQVCPNTRLIDVRIIDEDGFGRIDHAVKGLQYVLEQVFLDLENGGRVHSVVNLSVSGGHSMILKTVLFAVSKHIVVVGASGDDDSFSCETSPSESEFILSVGAATWQSSLPLPGSNYGSCIRLRVAAENIIAPYIGDSNEEMKSISGSSVSTAFISGLVAKAMSIVDIVPGARQALRLKYPEVMHRDIVDFYMDLVSTPTVFSAGAHSDHYSRCAMSNDAAISDHVRQVLDLSIQRTTSEGGRRAMQRMKRRFKESQRQKLESSYM